MKKLRVLITGGAGFIGSFLADTLIAKGHFVRILDNLEYQVHKGKKPSYLNSKADFIKGNVCNYKVINTALRNIDVVYHLASCVGVGQSNYEIKKYVDANVGGMANLLDSIVNNKLPIKKIIMTASMTSYGEGNYCCKRCGIIKPKLRTEDQLKKGKWESFCSKCNSHVTPVATSEESLMNDNSIYSLTKHTQESMLLLIGKLYHIPVVSLRCFNVYGPRQSLSNPYTGVSAIFISRLKNDKQPVIYEDGMQTRDFISVHDVVSALVAACDTKKANYQVLNIGSGKPTKIYDIAKTLAGLLHKDIKPLLNGEYRLNDIRHCFADIHKAKTILRWYPKISLEQGLNELICWSKKEHAVDEFDKASAQLSEKKLQYEK
jgi:dTDP-L-rhamnose 4-epimerase